MDDAFLYAEIERLDGEMASTPLILRPLDIYHVLIGKEERDEESCAYLDKITSWYVQRYGDEAVWDGVLSRDPIFFRGRVHLLEIIHNGVSERRGLDTFLKRLEDEGKPPSLEEWKYLARVALESSQDFSGLHNLEMAPRCYRLCNEISADELGLTSETLDQCFSRLGTFRARLSTPMRPLKSS